MKHTVFSTAAMLVPAVFVSYFAVDHVYAQAPPALGTFEWGSQTCPSGEHVEGTACCLATALQVSTKPCAGSTCSGGSADGVNCGSTCGAHADTGTGNCSLDCLCGGITGWWGGAISDVSAQPPGPGPETTITNRIWGPPVRAGCPAGATILATGEVPTWNFACVPDLASASSRSVNPWQGTWTVIVPDPSTLNATIGPVIGLGRYGFSFANRGLAGNSGSQYVLWSAYLTGGVGLTLSGGEWSGVTTITGNDSDIQLAFDQFYFDDGWMDVDGDYRFNQLDVDALPIGSGQIDAGDAARMQAFVDEGLDSGIFGDLDGDGMICAGDRAALATLIAQQVTLQHPDYNPRADWQLDGTIDQSDQAVFDLLLPAQSICPCAAPCVLHGDGPIAQTSPCSGYIDPRFDSTNGTDVDLGLVKLAASPTLVELTIAFSEAVYSSSGQSGGPLGTGDFILSETGMATPPTVTNLTNVGGNDTLFILELSRSITVQEWTTIRVVAQNVAGTAIANLGNLGVGQDEPDRVDIGFLERASPGQAGENTAQALGQCFKHSGFGSD